MIKKIEEGTLPKQTIKTVLKSLTKEMEESTKFNSLKTLAILQNTIPDEFLKSHMQKIQ